ncbi:hypothetical protein LSH36_3g21035 [Paralvinella palmiformis]|uniref:Uncharacterized protein n=1 Tax=Paralvinella palmiformis TaxID=53620 RepID=A0AAD9KFQ7_9ANNE|nr:hypothetical protein LSH36_3g21035 [Paralvinella palmiformis]
MKKECSCYTLQHLYIYIYSPSGNTKCKEQSLDSDGLATNDITTSERNVSSVNKNSTLESKTESNSTDFLASIGVTGGNFGQSILNNGTFGSFGNTTKRKTVSRQKHSQNRKLPGSHTSKNMDSLCEWSIDGSDFNKDDAVSVNWTRC